MPTTITKHIGTGYPAPGRDYDGPEMLKGFMPASLVTADEVWDCIFYKDATGGGEFVTTSTDNPCTFTMVTDATRNFTLRVASGHSWTDSFAASSYALKYDATKGVAVRNPSHRGNPFSILNGYCTVRGFQTKSGWSGPQNGDQTAVGGLMEDMLCETTNNAGVFSPSDNGILRNSIGIISAGGGAAMGGGNRSGNYSKVHNCTFVRLGASASGTAVGGDPSFPDLEILNCVFINFSTTFAAHITTAGAGIDYNASTTTLSLGSNSKPSITAASEFTDISVATPDLRRLAGSNLSGFGTVIGSFSDDVFGTARGASWDIGAQEYAAAGGAPGFANPLALLGVGRAV
jgi:hypothetical protein